MNLLHMKYAVEVAKVGSLNKAAEKLFVAPPNISRSIKELENIMQLTAKVTKVNSLEAFEKELEKMGY